MALLYSLVITISQWTSAPRTVIYGLLCVLINTANSWLCGCDSWLSLHSQSCSFSVSWYLSVSTKYCWSQSLNQACDERRAWVAHCCACCIDFMISHASETCMKPYRNTCIAGLAPLFLPLCCRCSLTPGSASPSSSEDVTYPSKHILPTVLVLSLLLLIIALLAWYFLR